MSFWHKNPLDTFCMVGRIGIGLNGSLNGSLNPVSTVAWKATCYIASSIPHIIKQAATCLNQMPGLGSILQQEEVRERGSGIEQSSLFFFRARLFESGQETRYHVHIPSSRHPGCTRAPQPYISTMNNGRTKCDTRLRRRG